MGFNTFVYPNSSAIYDTIDATISRTLKISLKRNFMFNFEKKKYKNGYMYMHSHMFPSDLNSLTPVREISKYLTLHLEPLNTSLKNFVSSKC